MQDLQFGFFVVQYAAQGGMPYGILPTAGLTEQQPGNQHQMKHDCTNDMLPRKASVFLGFYRLSVEGALCYALPINVLRGERVLKLLVAVKSEMITDLLASALSMHDVHTCDSGTDALAMLDTHRPDVLILELMLPVMDGLTVLRKSVYKPNIILALTNLASPAVLQAAAGAGVQDMLLIPCTIRHIIAHLNALIEKAPSAGS